jgi:hypothetical protein
MKKSIVFILLSFSLISLFAQDGQNGIPKMRSDTIPKFSIGLGTGINNYTALIGVSANLRVYNRVSVQGGVGIGGWGYKFSIGLKYDKHYNGGWSYGLGYSVCPGLNNVKANMKLESGVTQNVNLDYLKASTVNLKTGYTWRIGEMNTFYLDLGYAVPLQSGAWRVTDNSVLSGASESSIKMIQPGGIILGMGFTFGI